MSANKSRPRQRKGVGTTPTFVVGGNESVKELATFALTCLITPVSIAVIERVFSLVLSVKTKARNRTQLQLLDAILRIRTELLISNKCCKDFTASPNMIKSLSTDKVYGAGFSGEDSVMALIWSSSYDVGE
uniref:HAT C-terminal dimerisation domain-containing protein n=1 Tax=Arion vulgaris TaxID=1028688 RepID=A0A0B7BRE7_9EUPU